MESKLYEECHEGGGFMAEQAMLKQDETVRTQIPGIKHIVTLKPPQLVTGNNVACNLTE